MRGDAGGDDGPVHGLAPLEDASAPPRPRRRRPRGRRRWRARGGRGARRRAPAPRRPSRRSGPRRPASRCGRAGRRRSNAGEAGDATDGPFGVADGEPEAELRVVLPGPDELVGVGLDAGRDPQQHAGHGMARSHQRLDAVDLVEGVDDDPTDAVVEGAAQLVGALVVAVQHEALGGDARGSGDVVLAAGRHVEVAALLRGEAGHGHAEERLGGVVHARTEGGHGVTAARPQRAPRRRRTAASRTPRPGPGCRNHRPAAGRRSPTSAVSGRSPKGSRLTSRPVR